MGYSGWENYDPQSKKSAEHQYRGNVNHSIGQAFEDYLTLSCESLKDQQLAWIDKTPEPFHITGRHCVKGVFKGFLGFFETQAQPDFKGSVIGGRSIVFEAKSIQDDRIKQSAVTVTQTEALEAHTQLGALGYVYVTHQLKTFYRVPWSVWRSMKEIYGRKYMTVGELKAFGLKTRNGIILILEDIL